MIYSRQREVILDALLRSNTHPTADELYRAVQEREPGISIATVYRNLNQLCESGAVLRVNVPGKADRFDPICDGHLHMICTNCGKIEDIPSGVIPDICSEAAKATGYKVSECKLIFYGLCNACCGKSPTGDK